MTFAMSYNASEHYILVLSHDEVVHLKCSMLNKMPGLGRDKFQNLMAGYAFMLGHPGKKLLFMGQEFAHIDIRILGDQIPEIVRWKKIDHFYGHFLPRSSGGFGSAVVGDAGPQMTENKG